MKRQLLVLALAFLGFQLPAQQETLIYDLYANKVKMGKWEVSKTEEGELTIYESLREVVFKFLKTHRTVTAERLVYRNDTLLESGVEVFVNGELRRSFRTFVSGGEFFYHELGEPAVRLEQPVLFTDIQLFFEPPAAHDAVYFDHDGVFLPVRPIDPNSFAIQLPNGEENHYHYLDGRLTRATLEEGILHTYLRLRKQKERGVVMR